MSRIPHTFRATLRLCRTTGLALLLAAVSCRPLEAVSSKDTTPDPAARTNVASSQGGAGGASSTKKAGISGRGVILHDGARPIAAPPDDPLIARQVNLEGEDRSLSPYFLVQSDDPTVDQLPLRSTSADIDIAGVIADVKVTQVYKNDGKRPIEAIYVFPGSTRAAVYGLKMTIGERTIVAQIQRREEARQTYETAKREGKSASLLEQQRPNVFQMNVANIMPGDEIKVELSYTELLVPEDGIYELVYPTVVGPRYSNQPAAGAPETDKFVENPYLHQGQKPTYTFDLSATVSAGLPIQGIGSPTHAVNIQYEGASLASVNLDQAEKASGNKDFVLRYRLEGGQIESGLLLHQGKDENFFLLMAQPPKQVEVKDITPREYIFIVDISGSMRGYPLDTAKLLLRDLIGNLRSTDVFNVMLFAGSSTVMAERSIPANAANIQQAVNVIDGQRGGGSTELVPALRRALALPRSEGFSRTVVVVSDGYVSFEPQTFDLIRNNLGEANLFAFGIGNSINRYLIEGMARAGQGEPLIIMGPQDAAARAAKFRRYIEAPVLTGIRVKYEGFEAYDVEPPALPDLMAERPVVMVGKFRGKPSGRIVVSGRAAGKAYQATFDASSVKPRAENAALRSLWARTRIATLSDDHWLKPDNALVQQVTKLGLDYSLLTAYTSFVAVDSLVRNRDGDSETVKQALPLPEGVSDSAVGGVAQVLGARSASPVGGQVGGSGLGGGLGAAPASPGRGMGALGKGPTTTTVTRAKSAEAPAADRAESLSMAAPEPAPMKPAEAEKKDASATNVTTLPVKVTGALTSDVVERVIRQHLNQIRYEVQRVAGAGVRLEGRLTVRLQIDASGRVTKVELKDVSTGLDNASLKSGLERRFRGIMFPAASSGITTAEVTLLVRP